jgi:hypothetical protein
MRYTIILLALVVGCGASDPCPVEPQYWTDLGIGIYVEEGAADWAQAPDLGERVDTMAAVVAEYAGRESSEFIGTIAVFYASERVECGEWGLRPGCEHGGTWVAVGTSYPGVVSIELSALAHELLHILIDDTHHESDLWDHLEEYVRPRVAFAAYQTL